MSTAEHETGETEPGETEPVETGVVETDEVGAVEAGAVEAGETEPVGAEGVVDGSGAGEEAPRKPATSPRYARRQNVIAAGTLVLVGIAAAVLALRLGVGELAEPGAGMWPLMVSVVLVVFSAVLALRSAPTGDEEAFGRDALIVVVAVASLIAYALLFERIGFEVPTVAVLVLWIRGLGRQSWPTALGVGFGACAVIYGVFISALGVQLPHIVAF